MPNAYEELDQVKANFVPLSPLSFIERTAKVYPDRLSVIHGTRRYTWSQTYARTRQLASALKKLGIGKGDTVAIMGANTPETYEAHFGIPMAGAVLNALNIRLDAATISFILDHGEAKVLLTDKEFSTTIKKALEDCSSAPLVIDVDDILAGGGELIGEMDYEAFISTGDPEYEWQLPEDEWQALSLNYTSGTTGNPKGVVYSHRGAYMNSIGNAMAWDLNQGPTYLWTLPMFHCNGWCFPWTIAAYGGTNVCLRNVSAKEIYNAIAEHKINHFCGAPIVLGMVVNAAKKEIKPFDYVVEVMTAGAPPPAAILQSISEAGFRVTHAYGLTETYGPATVCAWQGAWDELQDQEKAAMNARQGVNYAVLDKLDVIDPVTMQPVPPDGETMGEVMFRGNNVMKGYLKNPEATKDATADGWFHSGDLGVMHPDGYIQLKDRSKDIIISGGENISSIEVENALYMHPAVSAAAVVAKEDEKWGETPCAFIELKPDADVVTEEEIIKFCRENLAHFKCPRHVVFGDLPKTSTGKIQKFILRERTKE
ncbi:MAG TPA: acyl-CoA synthetase [Rhodospirillales bacterium]|jgi:fatty-acyl-CoA synthase|nr:acyl-CoA synthetase [Rhodospirillales bacterium]